MNIPYDLAPATAQIATLADGVREEQFDDPTPCSDWPVRVLLNHLLTLTGEFAHGARKKPRESVPEPGRQPPASWRDMLRSRLDELADAWRDPAAWQGEATVGGVTMPGELTAAVATAELVLHGWDLAVATGQPYAPDPALVRVALGFAEQVADLPGGPFGPSVAVPAGAADLDRLLGFAGRASDWRPS